MVEDNKMKVVDISFLEWLLREHQKNLEVLTQIDPMSESIRELETEMEAIRDLISILHHLRIKYIVIIRVIE